FVHQRYGKPRAKRARAKSPDIELAHQLTEIEDKKKIRNSKFEIRNSRKARVIGFTGPGGAGKTTLIDELVLRFLNKDRPSSATATAGRPTRGASLSPDPPANGERRAAGGPAPKTKWREDPGFIRSRATPGQAGGGSPAR